MAMKSLIPILGLVSAVLVYSGALRAADPKSPTYELRWVWCMHNLQVKENADAVIRLIERAAQAGYNGVVLADYKFNILDRVPAHYFDNVARVRQAAAKHHIELIPTVFPIGYSAGLLAHDPNFAEGVPVKEAPFVVRGSEAALGPDPSARLVNGDLEQVQGDRFAGFSFQDDPGKTTFADREVRHGGQVSCRIQDTGRGPTGNARLVQRVRVRPYACYRFSAWVKTRDLRPTSGFKLMALGSKENRALTFDERSLKPTQDWQQVEVVFNSLDQSEVHLYAGQWGGQSGTFWLDDLALEELALVNVLRRPGCPLTVASSDSRTVYEEGKDYLPVRDEQLGQRPYGGEYEFRLAGARLRLTANSRIKAGDRLKVSWYHPILVHGKQVACCLAEPKVYDLLRDQVRRVQKLLEPKTFFFGHDEIRVAGWCRACQERHQTPGQLLAQNARRCVEMVKEVNPQARVVVWSDMFDPHHNAVDHYYLVNGSWAGSWEGVPKEVFIANWNGGKATASLKWFADRGHEQILAGYYDHGVENFRKWDQAARGVTGVRGFLYATWQNRYDQLEAFGALLRGQR
jgi:hypothetical protein